MSKQPDFNSIFFDNEFRALAGAKHGVIVRLSGLLFVTLIALGFAVGGLSNLRKRMDNPFTNWVDIEVNNNVSKQYPKLKAYFADKDTLKAYHLKGTSNWNLYYLSFFHRKFNPIRFNKDSSSVSYLKFGRTVNTDDELFMAIVDPNSKNLLYRNPDFFDPKTQELTKKCGIIITESLAKKLGYSEYNQLKKVAVEVSSTMLFLDVIAVVKQLPNLAHFATSPILYNILQGGGRCSELLIQNKSNNATSVRLLSASRDEEDYLRRKVQEIIHYDGDPTIQVNEEKLDPERSYYSYVFSMLEGDTTQIAKLHQFLDTCYATGRFREFNEVQCSDDCEKIQDPHYLTYNFDDLDKIRPFQGTLGEFGVEVPMHQVEAKENFQLVTSLTLILGFVLFVLGILSIILYLGNLLLNHIDNIRPNLGTFKAFGLANKVLSDLYSMIVLRLLGIGILIAAPLAGLTGWILDRLWLNIGFNLLHWVVGLSLTAIALICVFIARKMLAKVLSLTPGDLIYER